MQFEEPAVEVLFDKKHSLEERIFETRFDPSKEPNETIPDLQDLSTKLCAIERQLIEQIKASTDGFYNQLNLQDINMDNILEERKRDEKKIMLRPPSRPDFDSTLKNKKKSSDIVKSKEKISPSSSSVRRDSKRHSGTNSIFKSLSELFSSPPDSPSRSHDLIALENEITRIRAAILNLSQKKPRTEKQERDLQDLKNELRIRTTQLQKMISEESKVESTRDDQHHELLN